MSITNGYCTLEELKERLQLEDTVDDGMLEDCITSASRTIDQYCERQFFQTVEARYFEPPCGATLDFGPYNDLVSITSLKTDASGDGTFETTWSATDYQLGPVNRSGPEARPYETVTAVRRTWPWASGGASRLIEVTGTWGWSDVPQRVKTACLLQAQREARQRYMPTDGSYLPWTVVTANLAGYRRYALLGA